MKVSFNLRVRYEEANKCIDFINSIGGRGNIVTGGSEYFGNKEQITELINFMVKNDIDLGSMLIDDVLGKHRNEIIKQLKLMTND